MPSPRVHHRCVCRCRVCRVCRVCRRGVFFAEKKEVISWFLSDLVLDFFLLLLLSGAKGSSRKPAVISCHLRDALIYSISASFKPSPVMIFPSPPHHGILSQFSIPCLPKKTQPSSLCFEQYALGLSVSIRSFFLSASPSLPLITSVLSIDLPRCCFVPLSSGSLL